MLMVWLGLAAASWVPQGLGADTLINTGAVWKYFDNGASQGASWTAVEFDDSTWASGPAQLGFGDGDEATLVRRTNSTGQTNITIYFRRTFEIADASIFSNLQVRLLRDDGGVVYLNATEVFRSNMPTGAIANATLASASALGVDETTNFYTGVINPALLRGGTNVVAVEIHQNALNSSDLSFDLALLGNVLNAPPIVALTAPTNGSFFRAGTNVTLTASATDSDNGIARVVFYEGTNLLATDTNTPYSVVWSNVLEGAYALRAVATDTLGASSTSAVVNIALVTNFPPNAALVSPTNGQIFGGPLDVTIRATASDAEGAVSRVTFFAGSNYIGEASSAPFSVTWSNVALGLYSLTAVAVDELGAARTSAPVSITVRTNALPAVSLTNPRTNAVLSVFSNVLFTASATDSDGSILKVEFYEDGHRLGEDASRPTNSVYSYSWPPPAPGSYTLRAVATDLAGGMRTSAPVQIALVTNLLPQVAITTPVNNAIIGGRAPLPLRVSATDPDGSIALVELFQADLKIAEATAPPFDFVLSNLTAGGYTFRARATDNAGDAVSSATVNVTLHNRVEFVGKGSVWKYLATNSSQGTAWRQLSYGDGFWPAGRAQLGYGDGDEATVVPFGPEATNRWPTTYFRQSFVVTNAAAFSNLTVKLLRDDGGVVYLNGVEIFRSNMPTGEVLYTTFAAANALAADETVTFYSTNVSPSLLLEGTNVLAAEVHQANATSSDLSFDAELSGSDATSVTRGPYLQTGTPTSIIVRWRTDAPTDSRVRFGRDPGNLDQFVEDSTLTDEHLVILTGLNPDTAYFYSVGSAAASMAGGIDYQFVTAPPPGTAKATRIWVLGDSGKGDESARVVRDSYYNFSSSRAPDLWLMLGDNAYENGTDAEFQNALFDMFPGTLKRSVLWPIMSNHDTANSTNPAPDIPYFKNFTLPVAGEAGGVPSGTEKYYSFDYGDAHFVCLDSQTSLNGPAYPMLDWLEQDLAANRRNWTIVTCANPPYGTVGNNTDTMPRDLAVRTRVLPILEAHGVDLFIAGDDHGYERSYLMDRHYGIAATLTNSMILDGRAGDPDGTGPYNKQARGPVPHRGTVYVVAGNASHLDPVPAAAHPANYLTKVVLGSVVLDVTDGKLDVRFLQSDGAITDHFAIVKDNHAPVATALDLTIDEDVPDVIPLGATDREGAPLTATVLAVPTNGVAWLADGDGDFTVVTNGMALPAPIELLYKPAVDFNGEDHLSFKANDGFNDSAPAVISITVRAVNDAPDFLDGGSVTVLEDAGPQSFPGWATQLSAGPLDEAGQALAFEVGNDHPELFAVPPALSPDGTLTFTPTPDANGTALVTVVLRDTGGTDRGGTDASTPRTFTLTVQPVNDVPVAFGQARSMNEDGALPLLLTGSDVDGDALAFSIVTAPAHGTLSGAGGSRIYTPAANYHGPDSFTFQVNDGQLDSPPAAVSITIFPVNDAPVAHAQARSVNEDGALPITLTGSDVDGDSITFAVLTTPAHGTLNGAGGSRIYTPAANYHGPDSFTFQVNDGQLDSTPATVSITVVSVNDPPVAVPLVSNLIFLTPGSTNGIIVSGNNSNGVVLLDALLSHDEELDALEFAWFRAGSVAPFATGVTASNLIEVGTHVVVLVVDDGQDTGTATVTVDVVTAAEALDEVSRLLRESTLPRKPARPLLASLKAAQASFDRGKFSHAAKQLQAFQHKLEAQLARYDPALAAVLNNAVELILSSQSSKPRSGSSGPTTGRP